MKNTFLLIAMWPNVGIPLAQFDIMQYFNRFFEQIIFRQVNS
jgi:hypothetical protein